MVDMLVIGSGRPSIKYHMKWHGFNVRCIKDDNVVPIENSKIKSPGSSLIVKKINGGIVFEIGLNNTGKIDLSIFDIKGALVKKLSSKSNKNNQIAWDGKSASGNVAAAGTYYYRLISSKKNLGGHFVHIQ